MPRLKNSLQNHGLAYLSIVADYWGISNPVVDQNQLIKLLCEYMLDRELVTEVVTGLRVPAAEALSELVANRGRITIAKFEQKHGEIRRMGDAWLKREKPHRAPISPLEDLYYRGLIALAHLQSQDGPQEFVYIPDDLLPLIPAFNLTGEQLLGRPAKDSECKNQVFVTDHILDHATTLLANIRMQQDQGLNFQIGLENFLIQLLIHIGVLDSHETPQIENLRSFLSRPRREALADLVTGWLTSNTVNDLKLVPTLQAEGKWTNNPYQTRSNLIGFLVALPENVWWQTQSFIASIKTAHPEFQRVDGDFDSWYIKDRRTGNFLRGIDNWDAVEGAYISWMLTGPLHWLGIVDMADAQPKFKVDYLESNIPSAFKLSRWARKLLNGQVPRSIPEDLDRIHIRSDGRINVPRLAPRSARYLLARFCEWEQPVHEEYRYRPTPSSLQRAAKQGMRVGQLINLLAKNAEGIPPNVTKALKNWQRDGQAARIQTFPVLRLPSADALQELQKSRAARYLGDVLGPAAVALRPGTEARVIEILAELGFLGEIISQ